MDTLDYYERYAIPYYEQTIDLDLSEIMQEFVKLLPEDAEVLDLGCGSGRDTKALEEHGFYVTPMDGSAKMCELAEIYTDREVLHLTFEEMDFREVFDGIWACASLVHVPGEDMQRILGKVLEALKPEGVLYFSVYEGERDGVYGGRYYCDYTEKSLKHLLHHFHHAEVIDIWHTDDVRRDKEEHPWLNVLIRKRR